MRKVIAGLVAAGALVVPGAAQAHTGSVRCDATGVVFSYNANFERTTQVTEQVGGEYGAKRVVTVYRYHASTDTWAGVTGTVVASASWYGGGIRAVTVVCPAAPPVAPPAAPPVAPPVAPPAPPVAPPAPPPAAPPAPPALVVTTVSSSTAKKPPKRAPKCPKGTTRNWYNARTGVLVCIRIVRDVARVRHVTHVRAGGTTG